MESDSTSTNQLLLIILLWRFFLGAATLLMARNSWASGDYGLGQWASCVRRDGDRCLTCSTEPTWPTVSLTGTGLTHLMLSCAVRERLSSVSQSDQAHSDRKSHPGPDSVCSWDNMWGSAYVPKGSVLAMLSNLPLHPLRTGISTEWGWQIGLKYPDFPGVKYGKSIRKIEVKSLLPILTIKKKKKKKPLKPALCLVKDSFEAKLIFNTWKMGDDHTEEEVTGCKDQSDRVFFDLEAFCQTASTCLKAPALSSYVPLPPFFFLSSWHWGPKQRSDDIPFWESRRGALKQQDAKELSATGLQLLGALL